MAQIKITLTKSPIGRIPSQRKTVVALGDNQFIVVGFFLQPDGALGGGQSYVYRGFGGSWYST